MILSTNELTFRYCADSNPVFSNVSLRINQGDVLLLTGPSGCGKSTLAYCLAGLYPEYAGEMSGQVKIQGKDIHVLKPNQRCKYISMLFQNPDDQFCMNTPEREIIFALENVGFKGDFQNRCRELLDFVGMTEHGSVSLNHLSGGMKQKVALASAMATSPKVLVLDEPFANVDLDSIGEIIPKLVSLNKEHGFTIIAIDHNTSTWSGAAKRLIVMDTGGDIISDKITAQIPQQKQLFNMLNIKNNLNTNAEHDRMADDVNSAPTDAANSSIYSQKPAITAEDLSISYDNKNILSSASFKILKGQITMLTGKNGSGKSTLMWVLAGLKKFAGNIHINGHVGIVFQNPAYQFLTHNVLEEIEVSLGRQKDNAAVYLKQFRLYDKINESPYMLSQGQQRRLAVLAMIASKKEILLLDEPTYGQDSESTDFIMDLIGEKVYQGLTAIISTHDPEIISQYGNNTLHIEEGSVICTH